jgi:hypothetical protein
MSDRCRLQIVGKAGIGRERRLRARRGLNAFTPNNLGYYGYNETLNAYYEVISYAKLLADTKKRNRILFDKLNLPPPG